MKSFVAISLAAAVSAMDSATFSYMKYIAQQGKNYASLEEFNERAALFNQTDAELAEFNANPDRMMTVAHNFFSDMTAEEKKKMRGLLPEMNDARPATHFATEEEVGAYDDTLNWCSTQNTFGESKCTPVKNQGQCGGCWAFSATESVESAIAIQYNEKPVERSPQQLISCSSAYGNGGCDGGWYYYAWNYLESHNLETEAAYPYSNGSMYYGITGSCKYVANNGPTTKANDDYVVVGTTNADIKSALQKNPCSIAVDAESNGFMYYSSGVLMESNCGTRLDHAIQVVGYGTDTDNGVDYFLVRNSWGPTWGQNGFIYMQQSTSGGAPGTCGMNEKVMYPNVIQN